LNGILIPKQPPVADTAVLLVLMAMRRAGEAIRIVQDGKWPETPWSPFLLTGPALSRPSLTIGFLGFGRISHCTLQRLLAFTQSPTSDRPPRCIYTSSHARPEQQQIDEEYTLQFGISTKRVDADVLAAESDVLIILCTLNEKTKGMVNSAFLNSMKKDSVVINVARVSAFTTPSIHSTGS
jgi:glyoxylate/hydroxypyruvate reductase